MANLPETYLTSIDTIMGAKKSIPAYQRSFVWEDSLVSSFLDNIYDAFEKDAPNYFTGSMVFYRDEITGAYEIVDGQQRITVLYTLISEILKKLKEIHPESSFPEQEKAKYIFVQTGISKTEYFFIHRVRKIREYLEMIGDGKKQEYDNDDVFLKSLKACKDIVEEFVESINEKKSKQLENFYNYILGRVKIIPYLAVDINEALLIYSRLNSGGKVLGHLEIIKGQLFSEIGGLSSDEWDTLEERWEEFWKLFKEPIQIGGKHHFKPLIPEDTFISYYFFVKHPELVKKLIKGSDGFLPTNKISDFLSDKSLSKKIFEDPIEFIQDLTSFTESVQKLRMGKNQNQKIKNILKDIALLSQTQTQPLMFLLSCTSNGILLKNVVDRVFYLVFIFSMSFTGSGSRFTIWKNLSNAVNSNSKNLNKKELEKLITEELDREISIFWKSHFENLFDTIKINKAKKKVKTILSVLEIAIRREAGIESKEYYNEFHYQRKIDVDHLHPQNRSLGGKLDEEKQEKIIQSIGNAAFLNVPDNRALKDKPFDSLEKQSALERTNMFGTKSVVLDKSDVNGVDKKAVVQISKATKMGVSDIERRKKEMLAVLKKFVGAS